MGKITLKQGWFMLFFVLVTGVLVVGTIFEAFFTAEMTVAAMYSGEGAAFGRLVRMLLLVGLVNVFSFTLQARGLNGFAARGLARFRAAFSAHLIGLPHRLFARRQSGEVVSVYANDLPEAARLVTGYGYTFAAHILTFVISLGFMFYIHPLLTLAYVVSIPPLTYLQNKISASIFAKRMLFSQRRGELNGVAMDILQNVQTIKSFNAQEFFVKRFDEAYERFYDANYAGVKILANVVAVSLTSTMIPTFVLVFFAGQLVLGGQLPLELFITYTLIAFPLGGWLKVLSQQMAQLKQARASQTVLHEFMADADVPENVNHVRGGDVSLRGVTFGYDEERPVLQNFSAVFPAGKITALMGPSGAGKSTVAKLLLGLHVPQSGAVALPENGVGYVPQNSHLFPVSIKENIIGQAPYDDAKFKQVIQSCRLENFISTLSASADTLLEEVAANISGGQRQRIALARALYFDRAFLIFDEATSGLDAETEQEILADVKAHINATGKTALFITHSPSVANMADTIMQLEVQHEN